MAPRLKAPGAKKKAAKPAKKKAANNVVTLDKSRRRGSNTISSKEATAEIETIFELHRELNEVSGEIRKRINDQYATTASKMGVTKKLVKHIFALEKHRREVESKEAEFDARDREECLKGAQIFGEDSPFGAFLMRAAGNAPIDGFAGTEGVKDPDGHVVDDEPEE